MGFITIIQCDKCCKKKGLCNGVITKKFAMQISREDGWSIGQKQTLCPDCRKEKSGDKK